MPQTPMKPFMFKFLVLFIAVMFFVSCSNDDDDSLFESVSYEEVIVDYSEIELEIFELVNKYRNSKDLISLETMSVISSVAESHSEYMTKTGNVNHDNFFERHKVLVNNASAKVVGENVSFGYNTAKGVVDAWIASDGHRDIIESEEYTHFGISIVKDTNGKNYFTQIFIKR